MLCVYISSKLSLIIKYLLSTVFIRKCNFYLYFSLLTIINNNVVIHDTFIKNQLNPFNKIVVLNVLIILL